MKLFVNTHGIGVTFRNYPGQTDIETVVGLDDDGTPIENFAWKGVEYAADLASKMQSCPVQCIDCGYLFYSFKSQVSYIHFMASTAPMVKEYIDKYPSYKLLVPEHYYNRLHRELFELFSVPDDKIVLLKDNHVYSVTNFADRQWDDATFELTPQRIETYRDIISSLGVSPSGPKTRRIYIERDKTGNDAFNNSNTGRMRTIVNEDALIAALKEKGFEVVTLGSKTMREKKEALDGAHTIITPLGANCLNLMFTSPKHVIFLSNTSCLGDVFYTRLVHTFNQCMVEVMKFNDIKDKCDPHNRWNSPFVVNIGDVLRALS